MGFKVVDTTADTGIEVWSASLKGLFEEAARGLFNLMYHVDKVKPAKSITYQSQGIDRESTLVNMLNDIIFLHDAKKLLFNEIEVKELTDTMVKFELIGERFDPERHQLLTEIKAATLHNIEIKRDQGIYKCRIIFDV